MRLLLAAALLGACSKGPSAEPPRPPPDAEPVAVEEEAPDAGQDLDQVRQVAFADVIKRSYPGVQRCWEKAAADDFRLAGTVTLAARFGAGGKLRAVDVVTDGPGDPVLAACLVALYQGAEWAAVFEPDTSIEFPLKFEAPGAQYTVRSEDVPSGKLLHPANTGNPAVDLDLVSDWSTDTRLQLIFLRQLGLFVRVEPGTKGRIGTRPDGVRLRVPHVKPRRQSARPVVREPAAPWYRIAGGRGVVRFGHVEPNAYMGTIQLEAGVEVPEHDHPGSTEVLYILEGAGTMTVAGKKYPVEAGTAVQIPPGVKHGFSSGAAVRAVQFYTPSGPEQRFKAPPASP